MSERITLTQLDGSSFELDTSLFMWDEEGRAHGWGQTRIIIPARVVPVEETIEEIRRLIQEAKGD